MFLPPLKLHLKGIICFLSYNFGLLDVYCRMHFSKKRNYPAIIINYHRFVKNYDNVIDTEPTVTHRINDFRKEVRFLRRYFDIASLDTVVETLNAGQSFSRPTVVITVDDGFKDNFDLLLPVIKEENIPVTIFLTAAYIGTREKIWVNRLADIVWNTKKESFSADGLLERPQYPTSSAEDKRGLYVRLSQKLKNMDIQTRDKVLMDIEKQLGIPENAERVMLSWEEVRLMQGHQVTFGAHSCTHPILTNMPIEEAKREIAESKNIIEKQLGGKIKHFAYPNGRPEDFNDELRLFSKHIGFESICTCDYGNNISPEDVWTLKRLGSPVPISLYAINVIRTFLQ